MSEPEFDFPQSYIAGLLDATSRVRFPISETDDGQFTVHPALRIYPFDSEMRANVIGGFLEDQGYEYNYIDRERGRDFFRVQFVSELADLQIYLDGESAHLGRELAFVTETFAEQFDTEILTPQAIYRFLRIRDHLRYGWRPRGINHQSPSDIEAEYEIDTDVEIPALPAGSFRETYSIKYIAGLFDGGGRFRPSVAASSENTVGYRLQPTARLYRGGVNSTLIDHVRQFCTDYNLRVGDSSDERTLNMVFTGPGPIRRVLEVIYPQLFVSAEPAALLDEQVFPRFEAEDHLTKQGFYEILTMLDDITALSGGATRGREYTPEYFANLWSEDLDMDAPITPPADASSAIESEPEPAESEMDKEVETLTLDPDAFADTPGQYQSVVDHHHRDEETVAELKAMYSDRCQVCGDRRARPDGTGYSEVHYLHPLGEPHDGPKTIGNMLVLCPNHHADFDNGVISVDIELLTTSHPYDRSVDGRSLMVADSHDIDESCLAYHNEHLVARSAASEQSVNPE